ncbi:MAG: uroporphyrinogen-III C-methyltransferase [Lachnospiraceae bacterium]|nr:uroporphyrinogen-III C-methyltransferase [Lachnospiraceae bacterium]
MQKVYLVGAGPGDKELITVKGLKLLKECDVVIYDRLASFELLEEVRADCIKVCVGKEPGRHSMSQEEINGLLVEYGQKYDKVVRLKGGDSFVFGRGGEEAEALQKAGLSFELVPGVTSAVAVPECAGIPVTHRGMSQSFHVITGHTKDGEHALTEDYHILAGLDGTLVFLMGLGNLKEITERLMAHGKDKTTPAAVIEKGTTSEERMVRGTLENIYGKVSRAGLSSPVVILIGKTAALSYGKYKKCQKKTIGITATTGTADKLRSALEREGFHVVETCKMEVEEIREAG